MSQNQVQIQQSDNNLTVAGGGSNNVVIASNVAAALKVEADGVLVSQNQVTSFK